MLVTLLALRVADLKPPPQSTACLVKTRRAPHRHCRDARVYSHTTKTIRDNDREHTSPLLRLYYSTPFDGFPIPMRPTEGKRLPARYFQPRGPQVFEMFIMSRNLMKTLGSKNTVRDYSSKLFRVNF